MIEDIKANAEEYKARYEAVVEKLGAAQERIEELELERDGLKSLIADARDRFNELAGDCGRLLDQIKSHRQHV